jgi:hypothetical protein
VEGRRKKKKRKECRGKKRMRMKEEVNWTFRESGLEPIRK